MSAAPSGGAGGARRGRSLCRGRSSGSARGGAEGPSELRANGSAAPRGPSARRARAQLVRPAAAAGCATTPRCSERRRALPQQRRRALRPSRCLEQSKKNSARKKINKMRVLSFAELVIKLKASALNMRHAVTGEPGSAPRYPPALCGMLRSGGIFGQGVQAAATSLSCSAREAQGGKQRGARGCGAGGCSARNGRPHNAAPAGARSRLGDSRPSARAQQVGCFTECLSVLSGKPSGTPTAAHRAEAQLCSGSTCPAAAGCGSLTLQVHTESGDAF